MVWTVFFLVGFSWDQARVGSDSRLSSEVFSVVMMCMLLSLIAPLFSAQTTGAGPWKAASQGRFFFKYAKYVITKHLILFSMPKQILCYIFVQIR